MLFLKSRMVKSKQRICFVLTAEFAVTAFLLNHLRSLSVLYDVTVVVNTRNPDFLSQHGVKANVIPLAIYRDIHLFFDLVALFELVLLFYKHRFDAVHSITPKAGLLAMLAAWIMRVPLRVHTFTGQLWSTKTGLKRALLKQFDALVAWMATFNIVDSPSQCRFLLDEKVINSAKALVFKGGSISGVELGRFKPSLKARRSIRQQLGVADDKLIFLFLGRLTQDKGVLDLAYAFSELETSDVHLLFVGPDEQGMKSKIENITRSRASLVHFEGYTKEPERYMAAADVFFLPSYREGFGSVIIEAAAVGIPTIASRIYGVIDAVVDGETGLLHEPRDINAIKDCMRKMIANQAVRSKLGEQAQVRAIKKFDSKLITLEWVNFYQEHLN